MDRVYTYAGLRRRQLAAKSMAMYWAQVPGQVVGRTKWGGIINRPMLMPQVHVIERSHLGEDNLFLLGFVLTDRVLAADRPVGLKVHSTHAEALAALDEPLEPIAVLGPGHFKGDIGGPPRWRV